MEKTPEYTTQRLDHLGIVAGICQEIGLKAQINQALGETHIPHPEVAVGGNFG